MEFLGILLSTEGNQCTASISEDRILVVQQKIADIRRLGALAGSQPQEPYFPFRPDCPESYDIGYLELFTVFWAVVLWGKYITGKTVVIRIDNNCVIGQVEKWWGPAAYIPLLRQLFYVCVQHDVRLRPVYISSEDNIYADLLSRDRVEDFRARFEADKQRLVWIEDRDDWMLIPTLWHPLDVQLGPFTVDCCVSENGANSFCRVGWTKEDDARIMDFSGHNAWGNLPFSDFIDIVHNFLRCKRRAQRGTSATFLVPWWPGNPGFELVVSLPGVFRIAHGDWASDCYKLYIDLGREQQLLLPSAMAEGAAAATAAHRAGR
ncbi:hypothetical protein CYMTET_46003 [Cymbomonas tetramitiformis]|uniref:Uncharacterized protein n=1 Tax=Cymbomonas tetramitiformis TaxID=36881 RepID=A0AAE0BYB9_9CHLO|nr:hypothetical protein CYMTET_46003 [Cymbomonas tetramitiformis]